MKIKGNKKGISLTILIVTIIVVIILAAIVVLSFSKNNPLNIAREAAFKEDIRTYQNELNMVIAEQYAEKLGKRKEKITALEYTKGGEKNSVYTYISSFKKKYENKIAIEEDKIVYIGKDKKERMWMGSIAEINPMLIVKYVKENGEEIASDYEQIISNGYYEVDSPIIEGYEPEHYTISGKIEEDTEITVTYYPESKDLVYIGLDSNGNEIEDESQIVSYMVGDNKAFSGEVLIIPRTYNNKPVTSIKKYAFQNNKNINKVIIPESIQTVNGYAFNNSSVKILSINVAELPTYWLPFAGMKNLEEVVIGKNVKFLGGQAFAGDIKLEKLKIYTDNLEYITGYTFDNCLAIKEIEVNDNNTGYKSIDNVLYSKDGKKLLLYPSGKTNEEFKIESSVEEIGEYACSYNNYLKKVELPSSIKKVKGYAFDNCKSLEYVYLNAERLEGASIFSNSSVAKMDIGENVSFIAGAAIRQCSNLTEVNIFSEVADITGYQFNNCTSLKKFTLNEGHSKYIEIDGVLYSKDGKTLYACPPGKEGEFYIPDNVEIIRSGAFLSNYPNLTKLVLPVGIKNVDFNNSPLGDKIYYNGTLEQWGNVKTIFRYSNIKVVHCIDGDASI